jgi:dTMP kinase
LDVEYEQLLIPKPDLVVLLDVDPVVAQALKFAQRKEQGLAADDHEADLSMLERSRQAYLEASTMYPHSSSWKVIRVSEGRDMRPEDSIHVEVREIVLNSI